MLAGLRPGLLKDLGKDAGLKILDGKFTAVQQAIGTPKPAVAGAALLPNTSSTPRNRAW